MRILFAIFFLVGCTRTAVPPKKVKSYCVNTPDWHPVCTEISFGGGVQLSHCKLRFGEQDFTIYNPANVTTCEE